MSEVGEWGDNREGEEKKAGRSSLAGQIHESLPRESKGGGGGRCQLSCKVREYANTHTETVSMVMLASYESSHCCAGAMSCLCLLWK